MAEAPAPQPRWERWDGDSDRQVMKNIAYDLDAMERRMDGIGADIKAVKVLMWSLLVSITTGSLFLALNLIGAFNGGK